MLSISFGDEDSLNNRTVRPPKGGMDDQWDGGEPDYWKRVDEVEKGIASHADGSFSIDRPDPDDKELVGVDKEQRSRGDKDKGRREDRDRDDKDIDLDVECSPQKWKPTNKNDDTATDPYYKGVLEEGCFFLEGEGETT